MEETRSTGAVSCKKRRHRGPNAFFCTERMEFLCFSPHVKFEK